MSLDNTLTYQQAGVDLDRSNQLIKHIKKAAKTTPNKGVLAGVGGFGALFELPVNDYQQPVLVSGTDGVGTKLKLAIAEQDYQGIGIDLVAMCVNDIITTGAKPLYFLDYYATGRIDVAAASAVMTSIALGCQISNMALVGGETAELPGLYEEAVFDLAGFAVGVVEKAKIIDGSKVQAGDVLVGLASSGIHSNGYSLIHSLISSRQIDLQQDIAGATLAKRLLAPTKIYVDALAVVNQVLTPHALAHITGGGLVDNIPRVLPDHHQAIINTTALPKLPVYDWLQQTGAIAPEELFHTFNMGVGMVICVAEDQCDLLTKTLIAQGEQPYIIGSVQRSDNKEPGVVLR